MLKFANNLELPIEAVTQTFGLLGKRGGGKTYGAMKLAELMLNAGAQVVVLDPVGNWYGLRLSADGKGKGISIPVFGGENGDVPLEPEAGALIAKLIVEKQFSAVLDVSNFRKNDRKRFVTDFAEELFHRKKTSRSALHVFFEESQVFVPQKTFKGEERMLGAFEDLIKLGRNYGIGASLISQRPQAVNKDVLNQTEVLIAFQMTGPQERKTIAGWIAEKGLSENLEEILPALEIGQAYLWSPQWLKLSKKIRILKKWTYDASSTPAVGAKIVKPKDLSPVDVEKIKEEMSDVVKRAEENDPKALRKEIAGLRLELSKKTEVSTEDIDGREATLASAIGRFDELRRTIITNLWNMLSDTRDGINTYLDNIGADLQRLQGAGTPVFSPSPKVPKGVKTSPAPPPVAAPKAEARQTSAVAGDLSGLHARIVNALAELASFGITAPDRHQLSFYLGNKLTSGYGSRTVGELKTGGYVDYPSPGLLALTDAGRAAADSFDPPTSLAEFHNRVRRHLGGLHERILNSLIGHYPDSITRHDLGEELSVSLVSGYGSRTVGELKTAGLLVYPRPGEVRAHAGLFPVGLR